MSSDEELDLQQHFLHGKETADQVLSDVRRLVKDRRIALEAIGVRAQNVVRLSPKHPASPLDAVLQTLNLETLHLETLH